MKRRSPLSLLALCAWLGACRPGAQQSTVDGGNGPLVAFLGDSLTSGWRLGEDQAYPAVVAQRLRKDGYPLRVLNAGISGDSTSDALRRLDGVLAHKPDVVVVALGANDGLRGYDLSEMEANLRRIIESGRARGAKVLLVGIQIPATAESAYSRQFAAIYPKLARLHAIPLVPSLLEGVAGHGDLSFSDGIHPTAEGQQRLATNVLPYVWDLIAPRPMTSP
jgi:acyl-CoA thioesterase I